MREGCDLDRWDSRVPVGQSSAQMCEGVLLAVSGVSVVWRSMQAGICLSKSSARLDE